MAESQGVSSSIRADECKIGRRSRDRRQGWIDLRHRFAQVMAHLDAHAEEHPSIGSLADIADLSRFYFIRYYKRHVGETPAQTALRLRLARSRDRLATGQMGITEISARAGYGSVQAFAAAFRGRYGVMPARVRELTRLPSVPARVVWLEDRLVAGIPSGGARSHFLPAFEEGISALALKNADIVTRDVMVIIDSPEFFERDDGATHIAAEALVRSDNPEATIDVVVPASGPGAARGLDGIRLTGGPYLLVTAHGDWPRVADDLLQLTAKLGRNSRYAPRRGPILWRGLNDPWFTPPSERLRQIYIPLAMR